MQTLQSLIELYGVPQRISWGTHEGIRGAHWVDVRFDGAVHQRHYLPNATATAESKKTGRICEEAYQELLELLSSIPFEKMKSAELANVSPSIYCVTLECSWKNTHWEYVFLMQQDDQEIINQLAEMFLRLTEQARAGSDNNPE